MAKVRWGLLGAGNIVHRWIRGTYRLQDEMEVVAVASRSESRAAAMAAQYGIPEHMDYEQMLRRSDIDAVFIPVPHVGHKELALQAIAAGKAVLVEKPASICAPDFREMVACAEKNNVFLMEGVWTRFFPIYDRLREILNAGTIGDIRSLHSAFSFRAPDEAKNGRLLTLENAGGGLLDVGVYNLHFADLVFQKAPTQLMGLASMDTDHLHLQVDEQASYIAQYDRGELAVMSSGVRTQMEDTAYIYGTEGYIKLPRFWSPTRLILCRNGAEEVVEIPVPQVRSDTPDEGYSYEIAHVNDCIRKGMIQSPVCTWDASLRILEQCDALRRQWGLTYPAEKMGGNQ